MSGISALALLLIKLFFCFRHLGEGFANLVSALSETLARKGLLNQEQVEMVTRILSRLKQEPYLRFESSLDLVEALRSTGLEDTPTEVVDLANAIVESCPR